VIKYRINVSFLEPRVFGDSSGYFMETYNKEHFSEAGLNMTFIQGNESKSSKGVLRGLNFQKNIAKESLLE